MKLTCLTLAAVAGLASAQCISSIPQCAQECLASAISSATTCSATDYKCQCTTDNQSAVQSKSSSCVVSACGETEAINNVLPAAQAFCSAINAGQTCSSSAAGSATTSTSTSSSGSESASTSTTVTGGNASATSSALSITPGGPVSSVTGSSGTATAASSGSSSVVTAGAAPAVAGSVGSLGMFVLGALAVF